MQSIATNVEQLFHQAKNLATIDHSSFREGKGCIENIALAKFLELAGRHDLDIILLHSQFSHHPEIVYKIEFEIWHYVKDRHLVITFIISLMCKTHVRFRTVRVPVAISEDNVIFKIDRDEQATEKQTEGLVKLINFPELFYYQKAVR